VTVPDINHIRQWRQGDLLAEAHVPVVGEKFDNLDNCRLIIVSADCDVSNPDLSKEPHVELLVARAIGAADGNKTRGKNPREIHITIEDGMSKIVFRSFVDERERFPREILLPLTPDRSSWISKPDLRAIRRWLAKRYFRSAFPDQFNERLNVNRGAIRGRAKTGAEHIDSMWIVLDTREELGPGADYEIHVSALMTDSDFARPACREEAQRCFDDIVALVDGCPGITVKAEALEPESSFTLADVRVTDRWDLDDLTIRRPDDPEPPLEGSW